MAFFFGGGSVASEQAIHFDVQRANIEAVGFRDDGDLNISLDPETTEALYHVAQANVGRMLILTVEGLQFYRVNASVPVRSARQRARYPSPDLTARLMEIAAEQD
jgi:hypothetical protein